MHLDLESFRVRIDDKLKMGLKKKKMLANKGYGIAIKKIRESHNIKQSDIKNISEREVRRIEKGESFPTVKTLEILGKAHGMEFNDYLEEIATNINS